jgi:tetratricopeptide (TPR) repeat protein
MTIKLHKPLPPYAKRMALVSLLAIVAAVVTISFWLTRHAHRLEPPSLDLSAVDPEVAELIRRARADVGRQRQSASAWGRLGEALHAHDFLREATECYSRAASLDEQDPRWPYLQAALLGSTDLAGSIPLLKQAVKKSPATLAAPRLKLAEVLLLLNRLPEAEVELRLSQESDPLNMRGRLGLGRLALLRENWQLTIKELEPCTADEHARRKALALSAEAWNRIGDQKMAKAEEAKMAALPEDQPWPDPFLEEVFNLQRGLRSRLAQSDLLRRQGQPREAATFLRETLKRYPGSLEAQIRLGETLWSLQEVDLAEKAFADAVQTAPDSAEAWFGLACAQSRRQPRLAAQSFREAIRLKPDHVLAHYNLAERLKELGDRAGAVEEFRVTLRCRPDFEPARAALLQLDNVTSKKSG